MVNSQGWLEYYKRNVNLQACTVVESQILQLFSSEFGRIAFLARTNVKKPNFAIFPIRIVVFRLIAELSYRGAGRTLTEREYDAEIERF